MKLIERLQKKSPEEKVRIIWITLAIVIVLLAAVWVLVGRFSQYTAKDTTLFKSIGKGIKDVQNNFKK